MFAPTLAKRAAVSAARRCAFRCPIAAAVTAALLLSGCASATPPLAGRDPADPAAKVAPVGYRSTLAPYTRLRPVAPAPWGARDGDASPPPNPDR
jgi:hypothetical protein